MTSSQTERGRRRTSEDVRNLLASAGRYATVCRPAAVPTAVGASVAVAIGALGGGWGHGVKVGAATAPLLGSMEWLLAQNRQLTRRRHES